MEIFPDISLAVADLYLKTDPDEISSLLLSHVNNKPKTSQAHHLSI